MTSSTSATVSVRHAYILLTGSRRTSRRQAHHWFVVQAQRHCAATREPVNAAVTTFVGCFGRLWVVRPVGERVQGGLLALGCQWREGDW
jgi:hypothetical protein